MELLACAFHLQTDTFSNYKVPKQTLGGAKDAQIKRLFFFIRTLMLQEFFCTEVTTLKLLQTTGLTLNY